MEGIFDRLHSEEFRKLMDIIDPYSFVDSITIPKFLINAASDEFFVTDSWKFYWDDLKGKSHMRYVPNGSHESTMEKARDFRIYVVGEDAWQMEKPQKVFSKQP